MSSRQIKRLQRLVDASSLAEEECVREEFPSTMKPNAKGKKKSKRLQEDKDSVERDAPESNTATTATVDERKSDTAKETKKSERKRANVVDSGNANTEAPTKKEPTKPKKKGKNTEKRRELEKEEEALLEEAMRANGFAVEAGNTVFDLLTALTVCNPAHLNMREERIKLFGAAAVEDCGDGKTPQRRPDGLPVDNGSNSIFPEHPRTIRFRTNVLSTPNRYRWPPYNSLGVHFRAHPRPDSLDDSLASHFFTKDGPTFFILDTSSNAFLKNLSAFTEAVESHRGINELVSVLSVYGVYSVPPLLTLIDSFFTTGHRQYGQELTDVALYHVGCLLAGVVLPATWRQRVVLGAEPVMMTLKTGIEVALQRGCMNTAFEMSRLLLSFDPTDPFGALEYLAYSALRSKHWAWLLEVVEGSLKSYTSDSQAGIPWNNQQVGEYLRDVPSFFFGAALAKFFLESEYAEQKPSKVVKSMTENQKRAYEALDSSTDLLARSILAFPVAASLLVKEVCSDGEPRDPYWKTILEAEDYIRDNVPFESGSFNGNSYAVTAASVFVKLQANIWKPTEIQNLLRSVIDGGLSDYAKRSGKEVSFEVNATDATRVRLPLNPLNFGKSEAVAVPQELLQEMQREDANELDWMFDREVSSGDGSSWEDASDGEDEEWYSVNSDNSDNSGEDEL